MTRAGGLSAYFSALEQAAATAANAEHAFKVEAQIRGQALAAARAEAFRRMNFLKGLAGSLGAAADEQDAVRAARAYLCNRLGWEEMTAARTDVLEHFGDVARAVHGAIAGPPPEGAPEGSQPAAPKDTLAQASGVQDMPMQDMPMQDPSAAMAAFEAWYSATRETPFWHLFEHYMPETPLVDF